MWVGAGTPGTIWHLSPSRHRFTRLGAADDLSPRRPKRIGLGSGLGSGLHRGAVMRASETCIRIRMTSGRNGSGCRLWSDGTRA